MAELEKAVKATKKKASKKAAKVETTPPPAAPPQPKPQAKPAKWPRMVKCKHPSGDVRLLKVYPGVDGPLGVDDGKVVVVSGGWELME